MHLLIGLGNIGREYELTRHNFGFLLLDQIVEDSKMLWRFKSIEEEVKMLK
jgi:PTH1 family peptidyl-tRNA hydrolase